MLIFTFRFLVGLMWAYSGFLVQTDTNENKDATCGFMFPISGNLGGDPLYVYTASHRSRETQYSLFD